MPRRAIPVTIMRGGSSKGVFVRLDVLPDPGQDRDAMILALLGSPDPHQLDGLGGADQATSKLVAVCTSTEPGCDLDYLFAQVAIDQAVVDYGGNCGNLTTAVGPYAVDTGLVSAPGPDVELTLHNVNTARRVRVRFPIVDGLTAVDGDHRIAGVPGMAARMENEWLEPAGSVLGDLLPTGSPREFVDSDAFGEVEVSLLDAASPIAFVRADDVGMDGSEHPASINSNAPLLESLEELRGRCAVRLGLAADATDARTSSPNLPKLALLSPAGPGVDGDLRCQMVVMGKMLHAYAVTGLICTAAAVRTAGTLANEMARPGTGSEPVRLAHPGGTSELTVDASEEADGNLRIRSVTVARSARTLMHGEAYLR